MGKIVLKRRDIKVIMKTVDGNRHIDIAPVSSRVRSVIEKAKKKAGIDDDVTFMTALIRTSIDAITVKFESEVDAKRLIAKSIADTLNDAAS